MEPFLFDEADFPCFILDDGLMITQANPMAQMLHCPPGVFCTLLNEAQRDALAKGLPVQQPWTGSPIGGQQACVLPLKKGYLALLQPAHRPGMGQQVVLAQAMQQLQGLFVALPGIRYHLEENEEGQRLLEYVARQSYRLLRTASDQLWCARLEDGTPLQLETVDLDVLLQSLCRATQAALPAIQLTYTGPGLPLCVTGDRLLLETMVLELINNSISYAGEGIQIQLDLRQAGSRAVIQLRDNGKGMQPPVAQHAFEPYYSADPYCDTDERPGNGLGLYLVMRGVRAMGGECAMESEYGTGTQVSLALPLADDQSPQMGMPLMDYLMDRLSPVYVQLCPVGGRLWI